jgi:hypothetical protein
MDRVLLRKFGDRPIHPTTFLTAAAARKLLTRHPAEKHPGLHEWLGMPRKQPCVTAGAVRTDETILGSPMPHVASWRKLGHFSGTITFVHSMSV